MRYTRRWSAPQRVKIFANYFTRIRRAILPRLFVARLRHRYCPPCCATSCKSQACKTRKTHELGHFFFFFRHQRRERQQSGGRRKILNPPRSLGIWREPVRKQRRGVDYDDRGNNVPERCSCSPGRYVGGRFSRMYCTPKRDP